MMLADAMRAETWRLLQNRTAVFWSLLFVPLASLLLATASYLFLQSKISGATADLPPEVKLSLDRGTIDLGASLIDAAGGLANPGLLAFLLIGAATVFAGDYRWETWRLITARNSRPNLIMGKVGAVKLMTLAGLALFLAASLGADIAKGVIFGQGFTFGFGGEQARVFALTALLSYVRVVQFLLLSLLAATVTRSLLAALFVPLVIGVGQFFMGKLSLMFGWQIGDWPTMLLLPGDAYEVLKTAIAGGMEAASLPAGAVLRAITGLAAWCLLPFGAALWWFQRQDLSKE